MKEPASYKTKRYCLKKINGQRCGKEFVSDVYSNCEEHRKVYKKK